MAPGDPFGDMMNAPRKYVVSRTLEKPIWRNTTIIRDNVIESVRALKAQPGRNIVTDGSSQLVHALLAHDLVDELHLLVYPLTLGSGKRVLPDGVHSDIRLAVRDTLSERRGRAPLRAPASLGNETEGWLRVWDGRPGHEQTQQWTEHSRPSTRGGIHCRPVAERSRVPLRRVPKCDGGQNGERVGLDDADHRRVLMECRAERTGS